jgi:hypothetical protein
MFIKIDSERKIWDIGEYTSDKSDIGVESVNYLLLRAFIKLVFLMIKLLLEVVKIYHVNSRL